MAGSKTISLDQFRERKRKEQEESPSHGVMTWLFCPTCRTIEYTEVYAPQGRRHNCGTLVEECVVDLDFRAEITITEFNLRKIKALKKQNKGFALKKLMAKTFDNALDKLALSEETYLQRLNIAANYQATAYPIEDEKMMERFPECKINELGLMISGFRLEPEKRFLK